MIDPRCFGCHRPFETGNKIVNIDGFIYCAVCAADIENARRT